MGALKFRCSTDASQLRGRWGSWSRSERARQRGSEAARERGSEGASEGAGERARLRVRVWARGGVPVASLHGDDRRRELCDVWQAARPASDSLGKPPIRPRNRPPIRPRNQPALRGSEPGDTGSRCRKPTIERERARQRAEGGVRGGGARRSGSHADVQPTKKRTTQKDEGKAGLGARRMRGRSSHASAGERSAADGSRAPSQRGSGRTRAAASPRHD